MPPGRPDEIVIDDPALEGGEWLFRRQGQVFGPLSSVDLARLLYRGEIDASTPISSGDGRWVPVGQVGPFLVHARRAAAALRVEREVTGARALARRRSRAKTVALTLAIILLVVGAVGGAIVLGRRSADTSQLEDFGSGIRIASVARVGVSHRATTEDEIEVPIGGGAGGKASAQRSTRGVAAPPAPGAAPSGAVAGGDLVMAQVDARKIQAVVAREQRTLAECFKEEARRSPDFQGDVPIEFAIGNAGRVIELWIDEPRFKHGALRDCLLRQFRSSNWQFERFPGQRPTVQLAFHVGR